MTYKELNKLCGSLPATTYIVQWGDSSKEGKNLKYYITESHRIVSLGLTKKIQKELGLLMTIHGSCLCGAVRFEFEEAVGPFEICHCNRCRKISGAQGMPGIVVLASGYRMTQGKEMITTYAAPILYEPPAYHSLFCSKCGSPLPTPEPSGDRLEIPAGLLDDDPKLMPDKHIFTEFVPSWDRITDDLPKYDIKRLVLEREQRDLDEDFKLRTHYDDSSGT